MISIVITSFNEPNTIQRAIESFIKQKFSGFYELYVVAPDIETEKIVKKLSLNNKKIKFFKDPGKGKAYALNLIFPKLNGEYILLSDGDVYVSENSIQEILGGFKDKKIGCISGRPIPLENKKTKYGYWANFLFDSAHKWRKDSFKSNSFLECSGYLFAFRNKIIKEIPVDVAEDTIIPYYFFDKGFKIGYAENAKVYVKNVDNWKDWIKQKTRTSRGHETLKDYVDVRKIPRKKTFLNEAKEVSKVFSYPKNFLEFFWTLELICARIYMWMLVFYKIKIKKQTKIDCWRRIESTK